MQRATRGIGVDGDHLLAGLRQIDGDIGGDQRAPRSAAPRRESDQVATWPVLADRANQLDRRQLVDGLDFDLERGVCVVGSHIWRGRWSATRGRGGSLSFTTYAGGGRGIRRVVR